MAAPKGNKKTRKKKKGIDIFKEDCAEIIASGVSLKELFRKLDKILEYSLSRSLNRNDLINQIRLVNSEVFARIIIACLDNYELIDIIQFLTEADIDKDLFDHIRFIVAKYGPRYHELWDADLNEFGWRHTRHSIVERSENNYMLEFKVYLYNGEIVTIQDDAESMIQLASSIVDGVLKMNKLTKIEQEPILKLLEVSNQLLDGIS